MHMRESGVASLTSGTLQSGRIYLLCPLYILGPTDPFVCLLQGTKGYPGLKGDEGEVGDPGEDVSG